MASDRRGGRVLVAGAINTDLVARVRVSPAAGETVTGRDFAIFPGGKGANQAVAAARYGADTAMLGAVGADDFGRARRADLERAEVAIGDVAIVPGIASGVALIFVEASGENRIVYVPGATLTVTPEQAIAAFTRERPAVVLATVELPLGALEALLAAAQAAGATVVVNAAPEPAQAAQLLGLADVLIANETEARELLNLDAAYADWPAAARSLAELGPRSVVITLGADGAILFHGGHLSELPAPRVEAVDTTGAGDAFCGALAAALAGGADVPEASRAAVAAGALAVTKAGAQPSMPTRGDIGQFLALSVGQAG